MPAKYSSFVRKFVLDMLHKKKKTAEAIEEFRVYLKDPLFDGIPTVFQTESQFSTVLQN